MFFLVPTPPKAIMCTYYEAKSRPTNCVKHTTGYMIIARCAL